MKQTQLDSETHKGSIDSISTLDIQKIIQTLPYLTESELQQQLDKVCLNNPLIPEEETISQFLQSVENSSKLKSLVVKGSGTLSQLSPDVLRSGNSLTYSVDNPMENKESVTEFKYQEESIELNSPPKLNDEEREIMDTKVHSLQQLIDIERDEKEKCLQIIEQQNELIKQQQQLKEQQKHQIIALQQEVAQIQPLKQEINQLKRQVQDLEKQLQYERKQRNQSQYNKEINNLKEYLTVSITEQTRLLSLTKDFETKLQQKETLIQKLQMERENIKTEQQTPVKHTIKSSGSKESLENQKTERKSSSHELIRQLQDRISKLQTINRQMTLQSQDICSPVQHFEEQRQKYSSNQNLQIRKVQGPAIKDKSSEKDLENKRRQYLQQNKRFPQTQKSY